MAGAYLFATVLLNAGMAFLAIPAADNKSTGELASYISVVASLGSVVVGLILSSQNRERINAKDYIDEAADYLARHYQSRFGFEPLAVLYSLPFALLMWGTFAFLVAFLDMCLQEADNLTRALVSITSAVMLFGVVWCLDQGERSIFSRIIACVRESLPVWRSCPRTEAV
ncbi:hypothetical protein DFH07DRAFT_234433 [Mycena maculata]|uniref:Uncharacterized protein n=1 Tax=Mycena maculata TaxID=230809 RepID=A0AAD7MQZ3_9AGAR|nr:hypothetical protein DFH07DRAFT_234433 [Mycena maculata]